MAKANANKTQIATDDAIAHITQMNAIRLREKLRAHIETAIEAMAQEPFYPDVALERLRSIESIIKQSCD